MKRPQAAITIKSIALRYKIRQNGWLGSCQSLRLGSCLLRPATLTRMRMTSQITNFPEHSRFLEQWQMAERQILTGKLLNFLLLFQYKDSLTDFSTMSFTFVLCCQVQLPYFGHLLDAYCLVRKCLDGLTAFFFCYG
jgi:hypothetical protein